MRGDAQGNRSTRLRGGQARSGSRRRRDSRKRNWAVQWYGGIGGGLRNIICPKDTPIVIGLYARAEGVKSVIVNNLHLFCGIAATTQQTSEFPSAVFDGPNATSTYDFFGGNPVNEGNGTQRCPAGLVAVGINGRSGIWLDAVGLICGEPKLTASPVVRPPIVPLLLIDPPPVLPSKIA